MKEYIVPIGCLVGVLFTLGVILYMGWREGEIKFTFDKPRIWGIAMAISFLFVLESTVFAVVTDGRPEAILAYQSFIIAGVCLVGSFIGVVVEAHKKTHGRDGEDDQGFLPGERHPKLN